MNDIHPNTPGPDRRPALVSWASIALVLAMAGAGAWVAVRVPAGQRVPTHFNLAGQADGWSPAPVACFLLPVIGTLLLGLLALLPRLDPRGENLRRSAGAVRTVGLATLALLAVLHAAILGLALGRPMPLPTLLGAALAVALVLMGNVMGKLRWNYTVGIRTPWTLASERVWDRTHRFGGRCQVAAGLAALAALFVPGLPAEWRTLAAPVLGGVASLAAVFRSWQLWRADGGGQAGPGGPVSPGAAPR